MAKRATGGWHIKRDLRTGIYTVRFTHAGKRFHISTRETVLREAQKQAGRIYAEVVSDRRHGGLVSRVPIEDLMGEWLAAMRAEVSPEYHESFVMYAQVHWLAVFRSPADLTTARIADYTRQRLQRVTRSTVKKERSALRRFLAWAVERGFIGDLPAFPALPAKAQGKRAVVHHRVELTAEEAQSILAALPARTRGGHPARAFYTTMWETGLRRGSLRRLTAPLDYRRGASELRIRSEADKAREPRILPLTDAARSALDSVCPDVGPIFGTTDYRHTLREAARRAGIADWEHVSNHDFRHARLTFWGQQTTNLLGVQYLAGHRHASTTAKYMHAARRAAEAVLATRDGHRDGHQPKTESGGEEK